MSNKDPSFLDAWYDLERKILINKSIESIVRSLYDLSAEKSADYYIGKFEKLCSAIMSFIESDCRYMMCMLNSKIGDKKKFEALKTDLESYFDLHIETNLDAKKMKSKEKDFLEILNSDPKKKVIVITTYKSVGTGANLPYIIPEQSIDDFSYVDLDECRYEEKLQTDIDFMYLENPTHLVNLKDKSDQGAEAVHNAFSLKHSGSINKIDAFEIIKNRFEKRMGFSSKSIEDYKYSLFKLIDQAVGRMCRTQYKRKDIYIALDDDSFGSLALDTRDQLELTHEYYACIEYAKKHNQKVQKNNKHQKKLSNESLFALSASFIHQALQEGFSGNALLYNSMRNHLLKNPVCSISDLGEYDYLYFRHESKQYNCIEADKDKWIFCGQENKGRNFSEVSTRLPVLMKNEAIKDYLKAKAIPQPIATSLLK